MFRKLKKEVSLQERLKRQTAIYGIYLLNKTLLEWGLVVGNVQHMEKLREDNWTVEYESEYLNDKDLSLIKAQISFPGRTNKWLWCMDRIMQFALLLQTFICLSLLSFLSMCS